MSDPQQNTGYAVKAPSGGSLYVLNRDEKRYYDNRSKRYLQDNHFTNVTDLQDVDRVLMMELLVWRWGAWLAQEYDYDGNGVDTEALQKSINEYSKELRQLKRLLGIDKVTRDKERGQSFAVYLEDLRKRAKEFGIMREQQSVKAITLFQELKHLVTLHKNCDERERRENNIELTDVFEWIEKVAIPEFDEIDEYFRQNKQKYWVSEM